MSRRALILITCFAAVLLAAPTLGQEYSEYGNILTRLTVKDVPITAEVVSTPDKLYLGLSHRPGLPEGKGMLFLMDKAGLHGFCMRDMLFSIDMIWITDGKVAHIHHNLSPTDQGIFAPPVPVRLVLEVPGGFAERHAIRVGDSVVLQISTFAR